MGVAWKANLATIRHNSDVWGGYDVWNTNEAIDKAISTYGSRIINMAFGSGDMFSSTPDKIRYWYNRDILFVGAAGTTLWCDGPGRDRVLFPANMEEVVAATGVDADGRLTCNSHYGPEVELTAVVEQPATGSPLSHDPNISASGGSSNATAIVSGVAALIWSQNPGWTRNQVRNRLRQSAEYRLQKTTVLGYGRVNANCAVGGLCDAEIIGPRMIYDPYIEYATYTARPYIGTGPFSYQWSTGETTESITVEIPPYGEIRAFEVIVTDLSSGRSVKKGAGVGRATVCDHEPCSGNDPPQPDP
jgi:subtilisin family serine protease